MKHTLFILFIVLSFTFKGQSPTFLWAKHIGGIYQDFGMTVTSDLSGNIFTMGQYAGTVDVDPGSAVFNLNTSGMNSHHVFITKSDPNGNFIWAKDMGGSGPAQINGTSMVLDPFGNIFVYGYFYDVVDVDPGSGSFNLTSTGGLGDAFICKLSKTGNFIWAKQFGGANWDLANILSIDLTGNLYMTGRFEGPADFDPGPGIFSMIPVDYADTYILKLNSSGNFIWAKQIDTENGRAVVDWFGNIYTTGAFGGTADFDPGPGVFTLTASTGFADIYVSKLDNAGNFVWAKSFGGPVNESAGDVAVDGNGNVYLTGSYQSTTDFDPGSGTYTLTSAGSYDAFISKLDNYGNLIWARSMGGPKLDLGRCLMIDPCNSVQIGGLYQDTTDLNPGPGTLSFASQGMCDIFLTTLDTTGGFISAISFGGNGDDWVSCISGDKKGYILITGGFRNTSDLDPSAGTLTYTSAGDYDTFTSKFQISGCSFPLGIELQAEDTSSFKIFPNPSSGIFNIGGEFTEAKICIYDVLGKCVSDKNYRNETDIKIDLSSQSKGIYFVELMSESQRAFRKLVIN